MLRSLAICIPIVTLAVLGLVSPQVQEETLTLPGLSEPVEILRDPWGIAHIYAANEADLFFAQGYNAARDRLFQLELWRRAATGTMAEIQGERALERDLGSRLLSFRGDMQQELSHYHPRGAMIIEAFVRGVNAYVGEVREHPEGLPLEFRLLGLQPGKWTPEIVVSRHNGLFRNARDEIRLAQTAAEVGLQRLRELIDFRPQDPDLKEAAHLDLESLTSKVLHVYRASRSAWDFRPEDIIKPEWRAQQAASVTTRTTALSFWNLEAGSNNWVVAPHRSATGQAFMANDPHRSLQVPSLRYFVHLSAPGWDVIGGGEPALPGVSIGHNPFGAWGLTIFPVDQEDLYVYQTSPGDPSLYRYRDGWERMKEIEERFSVKGGRDVVQTLRFTRHGPVLYEDREKHLAYALRAAWLEAGSAPYLASLRFGEARSWEEFQQACGFFQTPSENMVWAGRDGAIGWQATGITPMRPNWTGLLPVPGDGRYEWRGYLPIAQLPQRSNPPAGVLATANQFNLPPAYPHPVGYRWTPPFRQARILEFLNARPLLSLGDMMELQTDFLSLPARTLVPLMASLDLPSGLDAAAKLLQAWNLRLEPDSPAAALYVLWERNLVERTWGLYLPERTEETLSPSLNKTLQWLVTPGARFGNDPVAGRDRLLAEALQAAVTELKRRQGDDPSQWKLGDERLHHVLIRHPLSRAVNSRLREQLDAGPAPRGGNRETVNMTTSRDNQRSGASFRVIVDLSNWDQSLASNAPGQSGDPENAHYRDLFPQWVKDRYFPLLYSRDKVESAAQSILVLKPARP